MSNWCTFSPSVEGLRDHECSWFFIQTWFHFNRGDKKPWPALMKKARPSHFMFMWLTFDKSWSVHGNGTNHWTGGTFFSAKLQDTSANSEQVYNKLRSIICRILWKYKNLLILSNWCTFSPSVEGLRDHECSWFFIQTWFTNIVIFRPDLVEIIFTLSLILHTNYWTNIKYRVISSQLK